jgi:hypothetical protein
LSACVIREEDALEMAQPWPWKLRGGDHVPLEVDVDRHVVAAEGVVSVRLPVGAVDLPEVAGVLVVIQDHLLVQLAQIRHQPLISPTRRSPAARASTSARVL